MTTKTNKSITSKILYKVTSVLSIFLAFMFCMSCDFSSFSSSSSQYSLIPISGNDAPIISPEDFFYINLKGSGYLGEGYDPLDYILHSMDQGPSIDCKIPKQTGSTEDLYCILDIMEGDLWYNNIALEYNVPPGMCNYLSFKVPWHFNEDIKRGPVKIYEKEIAEKIEITPGTSGTSGTPETTETTPAKTVYCLTSNAAPTHDKLGGCKENKEELSECSSEDINCVGTYTLHGKENITEGSWGKVGDYIGGLAKVAKDTPRDAEQGVPIALVTTVGSDAFTKEFTIPALVDEKLSRRASFIVANYWDGVENKNFENNSPAFYESGAEKEYKGYPYLTWSCLDQARETKHRINLVIREWNTQSEFFAYKESNGNEGDPDVVGKEGGECDYFEGDSVLDTDCNDFKDVGDFSGGYPNIKYDGASSSTP